MPPHGTTRSGPALREWGRALAAELVGTALLVALGLASLVPPAPAAPPLAHPALAFGGAVLALAEALGPASGAHLNPAVSLAAALAGRLAPQRAVAYALAQLAGALLGAAALLAAGPAPDLRAACTAPGAGVTPWAAAGAEALLTGTLALAALALWAAPRADPAASLKIGLLVAGLVFAGGPWSGASLNPARSLAPALLAGGACWDHHWVYWAGPLAGAALAALLHRALAAPAPAPAPPARPEELPLRAKPPAEP